MVAALGCHSNPLHAGKLIVMCVTICAGSYMRTCVCVYSYVYVYVYVYVFVYVYMCGYMCTCTCAPYIDHHPAQPHAQMARLQRFDRISTVLSFPSLRFDKVRCGKVPR